ncbi:hypothetical protein QYS46_21270 [Klebsiella michiganensis]|nr:hypothetical protein [Klebsiella michiganensis]
MKSIILVFAMLLALGQASTALYRLQYQNQCASDRPGRFLCAQQRASGRDGTGAGFYCTPELVALNSTNTLSATLASVPTRATAFRGCLMARAMPSLIASVLTPRARRPIRTAA